MVDFKKMLEKHRQNQNVLVEKHRPTSIDNYIGNDYAVRATKQFFLSWKTGNPYKNALLFYGPPGVGKTTLALLLGKATGQETIHLNASDLSKKEDLNYLLHNSKLDTFESAVKIIIVDECDRISANGQKILQKVIKETTQPMILICNDISKISPEIKMNTIPVVFTLMPDYLIKQRLEQVALAEKIDLPTDIISSILRYNKSVRGAVNALQEYIQTGEVSEDGRDLDLTDTEKMRKILNGIDQDIHMDLEQVNNWLACSKLDNYDVVSGIDLINRRVRDTQDYSLWEQGFAMVKTSRGKLVDYPYTYANIHNIKKSKKKEEKEVKEDEVIHIGKSGKSKGKKKDDGELKLSTFHDNNTSGLEEFL